MANFRVGQKVVCVNTKTFHGGHRERTPIREGAVYTVAEVGITHMGRPGIAVAEAPREFGLMYRDSRFRPLVDRPTDIGIFKALLNPSKVEERV